MSVSYGFDAGVITVRLSGTYETGDVRDALSAALADPRCDDANGLLFDVRGSRALAQRTAAEVRAMAQFIAMHADRFHRRLALLADSDAAFGLMRLGAVTVEQQGVETSVFRNLRDAEHWLLPGERA